MGECRTRHRQSALGEDADSFGDAPCAPFATRCAGTAVRLLPAKSEKIEGLRSISSNRVRGFVEAHVSDAHFGTARKTSIRPWNWAGNRRLYLAICRKPSRFRG